MKSGKELEAEENKELDLKDIDGKKVAFKDNTGKLLRYMERITYKINKLDYDFFIVVTGKERRGKSVIAGQIADKISNGNLKIENICMDGEEFMKALRNSKKGDVIIFDEAGTNLYSREAMSGMNRMLTKAFMVSGLKNICIILCIPSFFSLDNYIRQHRIDLLFYVPQRGKFLVYSTRKAKQISIKGAKEKKINVVAPNCKGWFVKQYPEYVEKEYRLKERKFKLGYIEDTGTNIEGHITVKEFAKRSGFNHKTVQNWISDDKLKHKKVGMHNWIPKDELERITKEKNRCNY